MKFMVFTMYDAAKAAEVMQASDKAAKMPGQKLLAVYGCLGIPFPGFPPNSLLGIGIREAESAEALASVLYTLTLAGATSWAVPVLEVPVGSGAAEEKKLRKCY